MKFIMKTVALLALVSGMATTANAQFEDPVTNAPDRGALIVSVWDPTAGKSLVYSIPNTFFSDAAGGLTPGTVSIPGFTDFFGTNNTNLQFTVTAAGAAGTVGPSIFVTGPTDGFTGLNNSRVQSTWGAARTFSTTLRNNLGTANCDVNNVCLAESTTSPVWAGGSDWGDLTAQLTVLTAAGDVGEALAFYQITQSSTLPTALADVNGVSGGAATGSLVSFLLDTSGNLQTLVVPLPAAVWLLLSGLVGFGAISRRRQQAAAA